MAVLSVSNAGKEFNDITILQNISFEVYENQRVGLVGRNGAGKTTLLKMISGVFECDEGSVFIEPRVRVGVLDQIPRYPEQMTVEDVLRTAFDETQKLRERMEQLEKRMAGGSKAELREYGEVSSTFESLGGYDVDVELARVANGLHIGEAMLATPFNRLSGGERTRINLGRMILMKVDLMLLDEPTNHLDFMSVEWLEEYLRLYKGTALIISHDRYFLDQTVTRIVEIEDKTAKVWEGNYSAYVYQKEEWLKAAESKIRQDERKIDQLAFTVRRLHGMGTEKLHKRAFSMEKRINRIKSEMPTIIREGKNIRASFGSTKRSGEDVLTIKALRKNFGERCLFADVNLEVKKDDRIVLLGANGSGKTTLIRILLGDMPYDEGKIRWGAGVKAAYLPQIVQFESERISVLECIINELRLSPAAARNRLGSFHFRGDDVFKLVGELSGGEKSRLKLCIMMYNGANVLILDEPTNHLDIRSTEWIEEAIEGFEGTLILISHDRYFINRFAQRVWSLENEGILDFEGSYEEFKEYAARMVAQAQAEPSAKESGKPKENAEAAERATDPGKRRTRETESARKQLTILEKKIEKQEQTVAAFDPMIEEASSDHVRLTALMEQKQAAERDLDAMIEEWEELMQRV